MEDYTHTYSPVWGATINTEVPESAAAPVNVILTPKPTPAPLHTEVVTETVALLTESTVGSYTAPLPAPSSDDGTYEAIIGGAIVAVLLLLVCVAVAVLYYVSTRKGSYVTHEMDEDDDSFDSHTALQVDTFVDGMDEELGG